MMKPLTEMEAQINEAAISAYKTAIKEIWSYSGSKWRDDLWRESIARVCRTALRDRGET